MNEGGVSTPLHETLPEDARERLFALMRELDAEGETYFAKGTRSLPPGTIAVGGALFDNGDLPGAIRMELVMALRTAESVEAAHQRAAVAVRLWVTRHNEKSRDRNWKRWEESGQDALANLVQHVKRAVGRA